MLFNSLTYPIQTEIYRKSLDPEVATWDEIVKAASAAEVLVKLDQKNRNEDELEYQSDESEYNEEDDVDAPADSGSDADKDVVEESPKREHGGRVGASQAPAETMRTAAIERDEQPLTLHQRDDFMRKGLCFNCGGRGHRARDCPSPKSQRSRNELEGGINTHAMFFPTGPQSRDALYQSTEIGNNLHVGSIRFDVLLEVEEGGGRKDESTTPTDFGVGTTEDARMSCEILNPEVDNGENPDFLTMEASPMPAYNADMSVEDKADAPPPVDPVDLIDPLMPSTDAYFPSAERLRYVEIGRDAGKDAREKEVEVRDAKEVEVGAKEVQGAFALTCKALAIDEPYANVTAATAAGHAEHHGAIGRFGDHPDFPFFLHHSHRHH
ncbi:hypothetical protein B0H14DRAFT_3493927 [Mycena olivaceomarginata]|nr:hypothetical protein B0H14DRAFT_3493927 [Mycena olivaceomarginata]